MKLSTELAIDGEVIKMKKDKTAVLLVCLLFFLGIAMLYLIDWRCQMLVCEEIQRLLGTIESFESDLTAEYFRTYLQSDPAQKESQVTIGAEILASSGYSYSAKRYIARIVFSENWPIYTVGLILFVGILVANLMLLRDYAIEYRKVRWNESRLSSRVSRLEKEQEQQITEITHFEENLYHQLQTPLTSLQLCYDQVKMKYNHELENDQLFFTMQAQLHKLSRLVTLFLRDRKVSSNIIKFQYEVEALDQIVECAIDQHAELAAFHNVTVKAVIPDEDYYVHCDIIWLTECIGTLLENAIEHSSSGQEVEIRLYKEARNYRIQVISSGSILTDKQMNTIFTRYYTGSSAHYGIGLHMAKTIVKNHHGTIQVHDKVNGETGVGFDVILPILDPQ